MLETFNCAFGELLTLNASANKFGANCALVLGEIESQIRALRAMMRIIMCNN